MRPSPTNLVAATVFSSPNFAAIFAISHLSVRNVAVLAYFTLTLMSHDNRATSAHTTGKLPFGIDAGALLSGELLCFCLCNGWCCKTHLAHNREHTSESIHAASSQLDIRLINGIVLHLRKFASCIENSFLAILYVQKRSKRMQRQTCRYKAEDISHANTSEQATARYAWMRLRDRQLRPAVAHGTRDQPRPEMPGGPRHFALLLHSRLRICVSTHCISCAAYLAYPYQTRIFTERVLETQRDRQTTRERA